MKGVPTAVAFRLLGWTAYPTEPQDLAVLGPFLPGRMLQHGWTYLSPGRTWDAGVALYSPTQRLKGSSFLVMTYFLLKDYNILPKKELPLSPWVEITCKVSNTTQGQLRLANHHPEHSWPGRLYPRARM